MKQKDFIDKHQSEWDQVSEKLNPETDAIDQYPANYRRLCRQYALANSRSYSVQLIKQLAVLVATMHRQIYAQNGLRQFNPLRFFAHDFPQAVRQQARWIIAATLIFYLPLVSIIVAIQYQPDLVYSLLDEGSVSQMEEMYSSEDGDIGKFRDAETDIGMFGFYIYNNTGIGFRNYASGLLFGVGTLIIILFNSLHIGAAAGHLTHMGMGDTFWPFVAGHSAFELTAITISAAGGLKLGLALLMPGNLSRKQALIEATRQTIPLIVGAAALFVMAAFIEAFWSSRSEIAVFIKYAVGAALWTLTLLYFLFMGRSQHGS